jgi:hypothetical protein
LRIILIIRGEDNKCLEEAVEVSVEVSVEDLAVDMDMAQVVIVYAPIADTDNLIN